MKNCVPAGMVKLDGWDCAVQFYRQGCLSQQPHIMGIIEHKSVSTGLSDILTSDRGFTDGDLSRPAPSLGLHICHLDIIPKTGLVGRGKNPVSEGNISYGYRFKEIWVILHIDPSL